MAKTVTVPVEPTPAMLLAADKAMMTPATPHGGYIRGRTGSAVYAAMIAAAPQQPAQDDEAGEIVRRLRERQSEWVENHLAIPADYDALAAADLIVRLTADVARLREDAGRLQSLINTPETEDFARGVDLEAAHQVERWGAEHDQQKEPHDWYWTLSYLAGKALHSITAGNIEKAKHHVITSAALLKNWHRQIAMKGGK